MGYGINSLHSFPVSDRKLVSKTVNRLVLGYNLKYTKGISNETRYLQTQVNL